MEWKHFIKYRLYEYAELLAWRQLNLELKKKDLQAIESFVLENRGKAYDITFDRMLTQESKLHSHG